MEGILYAKVQRLKEENKTLKRMKDEAEAEANYQQNANNERMEYFEKKLAEIEEKHDKEIAELKAKTLEIREEFARKIAILKQHLSIPTTEIQLPTENWNDVFAFLSRPQLANIVSQIGNRYFATKVQYYLHECGKFTLGKLLIKSSAKVNGPVILTEDRRELLLADVPMPENIINFKEIRISYFDEPVLVFLQEFQRSSLFANANLNLVYHFGSNVPMSAFQPNLVPSLFTNINSITVADPILLPIVQNEYSDLAMPMLTSARVLMTSYNSRNDWLYNWLKSPREDGKPRVLRLHDDGSDRPILSFIEHIKQEFLSAKLLTSFFITVKGFFQLDGPCRRPVYLENVQTMEKLAIKKAGRFGDVSISRHPIDANEEWIEEMGKYDGDLREYRHVKIGFSCQAGYGAHATHNGNRKIGQWKIGQYRE